MFINAIEKISGFTRAIHTITRTYGGLTTPGTSTLFFVNDEGVAITCKHVADLIMQTDAINQKYAEFKTLRAQIPEGRKYRAGLQGLEAKTKIKKEMIVSIKNRIVGVGQFTGITIHTHPTLDLAILVFNDFINKEYTSHATFINYAAKIKQGKYLCRYGFPFPEFNNFRYNEDIDDIEWTNEGIQLSPSFPIDGIITRFGGTVAELASIEMSTPGLRGQSGGPLFDEDGLVYGMQFVTNSFYLGFDVDNKEIIKDGRKQKVSDIAFLHVGHCIHVDRIKDFLRQHNILFYE